MPTAQKCKISDILLSEEEYDDADADDDADDADGKLSFLDPLSRLIIYYYIYQRMIPSPIFSYKSAFSTEIKKPDTLNMT